MLRTCASLCVRVSVVGLLVLTLSQHARAQEKPKSLPAPPQAASPQAGAEKAMMDAMTKAMTPGDNHKLLASVAGDWTFTMTMWVDPAAPPQQYTGTATYTPIMGGRYVQSTARGVMMGMPFEGMGINAYDNLTKQFVSSWIDSFGTGLTTMTGTYDAATKTITYQGEMADMMQPTVMIKVRQLIRFVDTDRHVMEWYETRGGKEARTMEIAYTRKK